MDQSPLDQSTLGQLPLQPEYTQNKEETFISLMVRSPQLYSELAKYTDGKLFITKAGRQLWKLIASGKTNEFALQEAINQSRLDEPDKQELRSMLGRVLHSPQPVIYEEAFGFAQKWLERATGEHLQTEPFDNAASWIEQLSRVSLAKSGPSPILNLEEPNWLSITEDIVAPEKSVPFAFPELNENGGLPKGAVAAFIAPSHSGKSKLAFYSAVHVARRGQHVLLVDLENTRRSSRRNLIACLTHRAWREIARMPQPERDAFLARIPALPLELSNPTGPGDATETGLRRLLHDYRARHKRFPDLLVVDQLGKIDAGGENASLHERGEARILALNKIAHEFDIAVIVPHQINREGIKESAKGKGINELMIGDSQKIYNWADYVFIIDTPFDDRDPDANNVRDVIYQKIRNRKARDERRLPTLYLTLDPARYIFDPIDAGKYIVAENEIKGNESKPKQPSANGASNVFEAAQAAQEEQRANTKKRPTSAGVTI